MKFFTFLFAVVVVVAIAGWARAGDTTDLNDRLKALESRLAAVERGVPIPADGIVRVRGLVVEDAKGRDRVVIQASDRGTEGITLRDAAGVPRVILGFEDASGATLGFSGPEGRQRLRLASSDRGTSIHLTASAERTQALMLDAPADGATGLGLWGGPGAQNEQSHAGFWIWKDGTITWGGGLKSAGRTGFLLKYDPDGKADFHVRDAAESTLWQMPIAK